MKKTILRTFSLFLCCFLLLSSTGCNTDEELHENNVSSPFSSDDSWNTIADESTNPLSHSLDTIDNTTDHTIHSDISTVDLMANFPVQEIAIEPSPISDDFLQTAADFSIRLLQQMDQKENTDASQDNASEDSNTQNSSDNKLISPLSILSALSMTANGAAGETQEQMLEVLCGGISIQELNQNMFSLQSQLPSTSHAKLHLANSIWFRDTDSTFQINEDFLQTNALYYYAELFSAPFNNQNLKDVNDWVYRKTDQQIPRILDEIFPNTVMYLINALAFDASWETSYMENQISDGTFTLENGQTVTVPMMHSEEGQYLKMDQAEGFIKPYQDGYSFVALLPDEGISLSEFIQGLTGDTLSRALHQTLEESVDVIIPKFTADYQTDLSDALKAMGMFAAFDPAQADLSAMTDNSLDTSLFISRVLHNTAITVTETGTKAGAATVVEIRSKGIPQPPQYQVVLDRPFLYLIIDQETNFPIFVGQMCNPQ